MATAPPGTITGSASKANGDDLDARILCMEKRVGTTLYRNILREYGRVNQPKLIRDAAVKRKVLQILESATRGFDRLDDVTKRLDPKHGYGAVGEAPGSAARRDRGPQHPPTRCPWARRTRRPKSTSRGITIAACQLEQPTFIAQDSTSRKECPMEDTQANQEESLDPTQVLAKAAILAECEKLAAAGVTFVAVHFDGYGDSGATEEAQCFDSDEYIHDDSQPIKHDVSHLQQHFEALVPFGYENDCGGFGDVVLDVEARRISVERNDRFEDYSTTTYEV